MNKVIRKEEKLNLDKRMKKNVIRGRIQIK